MALELTKQERWTLLFLIATGLLGLGVLCYKSLTARPKIEVISNQDIDKEIAATKIVNINTASKDKMMKLPGIGPALAETIIEYRTAHGGFKDKEEIKKVKGIGPAKFEKIKEYIKTE